MSICSKCGTKYPNNVRFCTRDGAVLEEEAPVETDLVGKVLAGKYRLDAYLSKGGMGSVFRATHLMLEKQVALKVIKPELVGSSEFVRRFQREARAATSLNHPNIVGVYDLGQTDDGTLYIAMEFVDGASLKDVIRRSGPMDPIRIVRIMRQILGALSLAHRHHIVHRDLKPQNIMLTTDRDGNEIAKLVDFGIAKTFDDRTQLTATGFAIGTPQYMAPEQAAGTEVDGRSDLYSLGIILYEMLIAEVPFNDPSTPAILVKHLTEVPVKPSLRRTDVAVHRGLEDVAVRCLEKDRAHRFQTAEEVAQAIAAAVSLDASAPSASEAATLPMNAAHLSTEPTRTAPPAQPIDSSMAPTIVPPARPAAAAAPTILDPVPAMTAGTTAPAAPTVAPAAAASVSSPAVAAPSAGAASMATPAPAAVSPAPSPAVPVAPPPPASMQQKPAAVLKSGRSSLALGIGALAIVALAAMGFAIRGIVGSDSESQSALNSAPTAPANTAQPSATPATQPPTPSSPAADAAKPADTAAAPASTPSAPPRDVAAAPADSSTATRTSNPSAGGRTPATPVRAQRDVPAPPAGNARSSSAAPATNERASAAAANASAAPAPPAAPQLPENPTVLLRCEGAIDVCGAVRDAFNAVLEREKMPLTSSAQRADVYIVVNATAVDGQAQQQFGTTFVVRSYAITVELETPRFDSAPGTPASRNFSADLRVGRERVNENARLVAMDTVEKIREFWNRKR